MTSCLRRGGGEDGAGGTLPAEVLTLSFSRCKSVQTEWTWSLKLVEKPGDILNHLHSCRNCARRTLPALRGREPPPHVGCILGARGPPLQQRTSAWLQYLWGQQLHLGGGFIRRNEGRLNCPAESPWGLPLSSPPVPRGEDAATDALKTPVEVPQPGTRG